MPVPSPPNLSLIFNAFFTFFQALENFLRGYGQVLAPITGRMVDRVGNGRRSGRCKAFSGLFGPHGPFRFIRIDVDHFARRHVHGHGHLVVHEVGIEGLAPIHDELL